MSNKRTLLFVDSVGIFSFFLLGYWLRFTLKVFPEKTMAPLTPYLQIAIFAALAWVLMLSILGLYRHQLFSNFCSELATILQASFWAMVFIMAGTALYRGFSYSRLALGLAGLLSLAGISFFHFLWHCRLKTERKNVLFVGSKINSEKILKRFRLHHPYFSIYLLPEETSGIEEKIKKIMPDFLIYCGTSPETNRAVQEIAEQLSTGLYLLPPFGHYLFSGQVENIDGLPLLTSGQLPLERWSSSFLKRCTDLILGIILCLVFCIILPLIAFAIRLDSPGPLFFTQIRVGKNRQLFKMFKFRTMKYPYSSFPPFTREEDPRITRLGRFLRRYNLDELPQIFNVLSGQMSLVGPRPISLDDTFFFTLPDFPRRLRIKPGLTGWAQIHGLRGSHTEPEERVYYDLYYLANWSWWLDLAIILCSPFSFKNAY